MPNFFFSFLKLFRINFGSKSGAGTSGSSGNVAELDRVTYGPSSGTEVSMQVYRSTSATTTTIAATASAIPKGKPGCTIHESSFSILCNTKPGIAGPHKWIITVKGQSSLFDTNIHTTYASPTIVSRSPAELQTDGTTKVVLSGTDFGTFDGKFRLHSNFVMFYF